MKPVKILALTLFCANPAFAALHDTGPMGSAASGIATPDAAVQSAIHLPDQATPVVTTGTAASIRFSAARKMRARASWARMKAMAKRISTESSAGRIYSHRADTLKAELAAIQEKYRFRMELEGAALSTRQSAALNADLDALDLAITEAITPTKS